MLYIVAAIALAGPPVTSTYEDAFLDFIDRGGVNMAPRLPVLASNDPTYSSGNPVYDSGADLATGSNPTASWYGDHTVAQFIVAQQGVRIAVKGADSQWSGTSERLLSGVARTWPVTWSAFCGTPTAGDPVTNVRSSLVADFFITSQWNKTDGTTDDSVAIGTVLSGEGLGDPGQIPVPFGWVEGGTNTDIAGLIATGYNTPGDIWYDDDNWGSNANPVTIGFRLYFLAGGSATAPVDWDLDIEHYDDGGFTTTDDGITDTTALAESHTLNGTNNSAVLSYYDTEAVENRTSNNVSRPRTRIRQETTDITGKGFFLLGGILHRYDGESIEDNISFVQNRYAAGTNPGVWIHGATMTTATQRTHGSDHATRVFANEMAMEPNVFVYSYGHNSVTRTGTGFKAESEFQADLFDLIYQDANDYYVENGSYPRILVLIPWYAGNMDQTRHDEMIGVVDALRSVGIPTLAADLFNINDGEDFTTIANGEADWTTATSFALDGDNDPEGTGIHPKDANSARTAAYQLWTAISEASEYTPSNRSRVRDGTRSR
jgi:hypothetical protein